MDLLYLAFRSPFSMMVLCQALPTNNFQYITFIVLFIVRVAVLQNNLISPYIETSAIQDCGPEEGYFQITCSVAASFDFIPYAFFIKPGQRQSLLQHISLKKNSLFCFSCFLLFLSGDIEINPGPNQSFRIAHFNCQSIFPTAEFDKPLLLEEFVKDKNIDILAVTETWIPPTAPPSVVRSFTPTGFSFSHSSRKDTLRGRGGGIGFIYKKSLNFSPILLPEFDTFECLGHKLVIKNRSYICVCLYRHISSTTGQFLNEFGSLLEILATSSSDLLLLGDFNIHVNKNNDYSSCSFSSLLESFGLCQYVDFPTHKVSGNILDLFISNLDKNLISAVESGHLPFSDHEPYVCELQLLKDYRPKESFKFCRIFKSFNYNNFSEDLKHTDLFTRDNSLLDLDHFIDLFYNTLQTLLDKHAPIKRIKVVDRVNQPFYTPEIKLQKQIRSKLESKWRRDKTTENETKFKFQAKHVSHLLKIAKRNYYRRTISEYACNPKKLWNVLSSLLGRGKCSTLPQSLNDASLSASFADFFDNKVKRLSASLLSRLNIGASPHVVPPLQPPLLSFLSDASENEVLAAINRSSNAFMDSDILPTKYMKLCLPVLITPITHMVNLSLQQGEFPNKFKTAVVRPLLKKPDLPKDELGSYRPVSNLFFLSKVIERIVYNRLNSHIAAFPALSQFQSAYRKYHSCETALTKIVNDLLNAVEGKKVTALVLLDLSAAFDTVDHEILLGRLNTYFGISGNALKFFQSYLSDRSQQVAIGDSISPILAVPTGVPQGSVLGPVLFSLYTSPLDQIIGNSTTKYHFYADDTQIYISFSPNDADYSFTALSGKLTEVHNWLINNKLTVNPSKTEFLLIGTRQQCNKVSNPSIDFQGSSLVPTDSARNLGVIIDSNLTFQKQISKVCQISFFQIRQLRAIRPYLDMNTAVMLANALVSSRLDFCNSLYYGLPLHRIHSLQRVQNSIARLTVPGTGFRDHMTPVLKRLHWLPVQQRIEFKIAVTTFKVLQNQQPQYLANLLTRMPDSSRRSSGKNLLQMPFIKSEIGRRSFSYAAPKIWNSLPQSIRDITSLEMFKRHLKASLFPV